MEVPCPQCGVLVGHSTEVPAMNDVMHYYFKCARDSCRCHFKATVVPGYPPNITHRSPPIRRTLNDPLAAFMGCPDCGVRGKIKMTMRREDGYWRRIICTRCGPYYAVDNGGHISIHKRLHAKTAIEV